MSNLIFSPASKAQSQFLLSDAFFTLYGGAAFSGKSYCILGSMLPLVSHPGTRAVVIRATTKQLSGSGSLFDAAINLYSKVDPKLKIKSRDLTLVFSSGAEIQFTYLDKPADRMNLQGREYSRICFDECQQLSADNVFYALSRLRSTRVDYQLRAVASCNPDPSSFLMDFVRFSLDENLIPVRKEEYKKRYFFRSPSGLLWYDSLEEAEAVHGSGPESGVKSFLFVPGCILDNPIGLEQNKEYIATLKALPPTESKRLLEGAWVMEQKSGFFKRNWITLCDQPNLAAKRRVRAWDLAFSEPSEARPRVDATAGVLGSKDANSKYTIEDVVVIRKRVHDVEKKIFDVAYQDGPDVLISLPLDPGATAGAYCRDLAKRLAEKGFSVKLTRPEKGKLQRFLPFASVAEAGFVNVVRGPWTEDYLNELEQTEFGPRTFDDQADSTSDMFFHLAKDFTLPDMQLHTTTFQTVAPSRFTFNSFSGSTGLIAPAMPLTLPSFSSIK